MKRSDIVRTIQVQFRHMRASDAAAILDTVSDHMIEAIAAGDRIEVRGFGTFQPAPARPRLVITHALANQCHCQPAQPYCSSPVAN